MPKLNELTFNHMIPATFQIEGVDCIPDDKQHYSSYGQYADLLDGYLYAQETILPMLRQFGLEGVTAEMVINSIKQLHKRFAHSMFEFVPKAYRSGSSGGFLETLIVQWHFGNTMQNEIAMHLLGVNPEIKTQPQLIALFKQKYPAIKEQEIIDFLKIIKAMMADDSKPIHPSLAKTMLVTTNPVGKFLVGFNRIATAWHDKTLSQAERIIIGKFVNFIDYPDRIEPAMVQMTQSMLDKWKTVRTENFEEFSLFLAETFHGFMKIHPFANANKRTARCWLNVMLRFSGYPDIMLKKLEDVAYIKSDEDSISELTSNIREAMAKAQNPEPISEENQLLEKLYDARIAVFYIFKQILPLDANYDFADLINRAYRKNLQLLMHMDHASAPAQLLCNQFILAEAQSVLIALQQRAEKNASQTIARFTPFKPSNDQIKVQLKTLFGFEHWKVAKTQTVWIEMTDKEQAEALILKLDEKPFCEAKLMKRSDTGAWVVTLNSINLAKLFETKTQQDVADEYKPVDKPSSPRAL